ncbi:MAG: AAA family ATPase [Phycisphaerales bacterium]
MADYASDGALLVIGVLAFLMTTPRPTLLLIDELERGLHPRALARFVQQLREIQKLHPDVQIVATTHSPYLLDCFKPEEIRLTYAEPGKPATIAKLTDHPDWERWKDEMAPGEFWASVGEEWIAKLKGPKA